MDSEASKIESVLFIAGEPVPLKSLGEALGRSLAEIRALVNKMELSYLAEGRGFRLLCTEETAQLTAAPENAPFVEAVLTPLQKKNVSNSMLETLAIVAYRQPVTRSEIEEVRGVRSEYAVTQLLKLGLIAVSGRKDVPGRPMLFVTTDAFLHKFGIHSLGELPRLQEEFLENV